MSPARIPADRDAVGPRRSAAIEISLDGRPVAGLRGQTLAGVLLGSGRLAWRTTSTRDEARGVFCGIGVCFDCIAEVNGERDVRLCQRRASDGDRVVSQHDALPSPVTDAEASPSGAAPDRGVTS